MKTERHTGGGALPPQRGVTHTAASIVLQDLSVRQLEPLSRLRRGSLGLSGAVKRVCGHRTLSTLILELEQSMYSLVEGTWNKTGNTVRRTSVTVLLSSTMPVSYCRMAHVMAM